MTRLLLAPLFGIAASTLMLLNIMFWTLVLLVSSMVKLVFPFRRLSLQIDAIQLRMAETWIAGNSGCIKLIGRPQWDISGVDGLNPGQRYLVVCNHQSWVDILVLQYVLNRRIAVMKFLMRRELIWVPILGVACWALGYPLMRSRSRGHPDKLLRDRRRDQVAIRAACEKFSLVPTSVMNFVEGTRCTHKKRMRQQSPYQHLLKPKAGGLALTLEAMGDKFGAVLDITIVYPAGAPSMFQYLQGLVPKVIVETRVLPVPSVHGMQGQEGSLLLHDTCQHWVNQLWREKDARIAALLAAQTPQ